MPSTPLALFGDLGFQELLLVAVASVMIFGKRLPEVAGQAFAQFQKARRSLTQLWRETGIDEELRRIQRDVDRQLPRERRLPAAPRHAPRSTVARGPSGSDVSVPVPPPERATDAEPALHEGAQPGLQPPSAPETAAGAAPASHGEVRREP